MAKKDIVAVAAEAYSVCARHGLELVRVMPNRSYSAFVAQARHPKGADILIKRGSGVGRTRREMKANQLWSMVGAATFAVELEPGVMMREFSCGSTLRELPDFGQGYAEKVGELLAKMHSVKLNQHGPFLDGRAYVEQRYRAQRSRYFPQDHRRVFEESCQELLYGTQFGNELAHGDFAGSNIMLADGRLFAFDARGFYGGAAIDLVAYVMHLRNVDPLAKLREVLRGYGEAPAGLSAVLTWRVVVSAHAQNSRFGQWHTQLADRIAEAGSFRAVDEWLAESQPSFPVQRHLTFDHLPTRPFARFERPLDA